MKTTPIIITGAGGRMGKALITQAVSDGEIQVVGATEHPDSKAIGQDAGIIAGLPALGVSVSKSLESLLSSKEIASSKKKAVIIDFTLPEATIQNVRLAASLGHPLVIGTTGMNPEEKEVVGFTAKKIPIVMAPNMSVGVNTLFKLVADAAQILGEGYDLEIIEAHHRLKKDAPSGTAVRIAEILAEATGRKYPKDINFHRQGMIGERKPNEIGMQVIRGGDIVGDHTVYYCGEGERLEIKHVATSRVTFAKGALRAATWVMSQNPGFYDMRDVLNIPK